MGNFLFRRKKVVAEELEELQKRGEALETQIRNSMATKQSIQWFSSLTLFLLMCVSIGFSLINVPGKGMRMVYSVFSVFTGFFLFYCCRRLTNEYYNWSIQKKINAREDIVKKKRELLEKVKETETFKVAKEILEKYDDASQIPDPVQPPHAPPRPSLDPKTVQQLNSSNTSYNSSVNPKEKAVDKADEFVEDVKPADEISGGFEASLLPETHPMRMVSPKPPRPFFKPQRSVAEKLVDFIIGDTPTDRFALICSHCYGHNGMARKEEFDFLSYRCWLCGEFNPARRQKKNATTLKQTLSERNLLAGSFSDDESEQQLTSTPKEVRSRLKARSISHQRPLTTSDHKLDEIGSGDVAKE